MERWNLWLIFPPNSQFLKILAPAVDRVNEISYQAKAKAKAKAEAKAEAQALVATIAILRYKQRRETYPNSLDELIAGGYLKEFPVDSYSDKSLVYKKADNKFLLYSVGMNFTDDGGKVAKRDNGRVKKYAGEGNWVFWPVSK